MCMVFGFPLLGEDDGVLKEEHPAMVFGVVLHQHQVSLSEHLPMSPHVTLQQEREGGETASHSVTKAGKS